MSADEIAKILAILRNNTNISVEVKMSTLKGTHVTTILLKEVTGFQKISKKPRDRGKKKKNPSKLKRDKKRLEAFLSRKERSCDQDFEAAKFSPSTTQRTSPRRTVTAGRKLGSGTGGAGIDEGGVVWDPVVGVSFSPIQQLDGGGGGVPFCAHNLRYERIKHDDHTCDDCNKNLFDIVAYACDRGQCNYGLCFECWIDGH
jgi:hypothetical protein